MKNIILNLVFTFTICCSYGQVTVSAPMISCITAKLSNVNKDVVSTVGELTLIGKSKGLYLGSGFYRSNDGSHFTNTIVNVRPELELSVYPNPFTNQLTAYPNSEYKLLDLTGKQVFDSSNGSDLSQLPDGVYILNVGFKNITVTKVAR